MRCNNENTSKTTGDEEEGTMAEMKQFLPQQVKLGNVTPKQGYEQSYPCRAAEEGILHCHYLPEETNKKNA